MSKNVMQRPQLSIIIAVLDSPNVLERQIKWFDSWMPKEVEVIIVDDGSDPQIKPAHAWGVNFDLQIDYTQDTRDWSQPCARNHGATMAESNKLLFTDIDHILSPEAIFYCRRSTDDKVMFPRYWGILNEVGGICQEVKRLFEYGLSEELVEKRGLEAGKHLNTFMIRKELFEMLGGYDESFCGKYGGDDTNFANRYGHLCRVEGKCKPHVIGPSIYVYPDPNKDKKEIFHNLRRKKRS